VPRAQEVERARLLHARSTQHELASLREDRDLVRAGDRQARAAYVTAAGIAANEAAPIRAGRAGGRSTGRCATAAESTQQRQDGLLREDLGRDAIERLNDRQTQRTERIAD